MKKIALQIAVLIPIIWLGLFLFEKDTSLKQDPSSPEKLSHSSSSSAFQVAPEFFLKGDGSNIEAPEFFEQENPQDTLLFISGKSSESLEIWPFPFENGQERVFKRESSPNGLLVDQESNILYIADLDKNRVEYVSLPDLTSQGVIGEDSLKPGEHNLTLLTLPDGRKRLYVTDDENVFGFNLENGKQEVQFSPEVDSIEEVVADSFYQIMYVPDESGVRSQKNKDGAILAFYPDGKPYQKNGTQYLGEGLYAGDAEGIELYRCLNASSQDTGKGFIISVDQNPNENNGLEIFDRETWKHLGTLHLVGVTQTDGIDIHERPLPGYPQGLLAASDNDKAVAITSWEKIANAMKLTCN